MGETRTPVCTLEDLDTLDEAEILEGYMDGRAGEPEPGGNRSRSYWHGWRNGAADYGYRQSDAAQHELARAFIKRQRQRRAPTEPEVAASVEGEGHG